MFGRFEFEVHNFVFFSYICNGHKQDFSVSNSFYTSFTFTLSFTNSCCVLHKILEYYYEFDFQYHFNGALLILLKLLIVGVASNSSLSLIYY
jgi:hypothetical protein